MSADDDHELEPLEQGIEQTMSYAYESVDPEHEADLLEALCEGFVRANQIQIRVNPNAYPCCLGCGNYRYVPPSNCKVFDYRRHRRVDPSCQKVLGAAPMHRAKEGTCIDLACLLCAIVREKDGDRSAKVGIEYQRNAHDEILPGKYHAIVVKSDGTILDPQLQLEALATQQMASTLATGNAFAIGDSCGCKAEREPA